ncbi:MAG: hypothetical protein HYR63_10570 [Proteobacteria bacterium]|nr:hypothetical protein [Pseudomonadota bacterium]MBI3499366.1 hypothetical protein [Pseudomonadota bacterium]
MMRLAAALSILPLIAIPVSIEPISPILLAAALSAVLLGLGVARRSLAWLSAGALPATANYALALWWSAAPMGLGAAIVFALSLSSVVNLVAGDARFGAARVAPEARTLLLRHWLAHGVATTFIAALALIVAMLVAPGLPPLLRPVLAGAGALLVLLAALPTSDAADERD